MALGFQRQGIFGRRNPLDMQPPVQAMPQPDAMPIGVEQITKKPGFFGQGGIGRHIAGTIGDALLTFGGGEPVYAPAMMQREDARIRQQMADRQRMQKREDMLWEWQNKPKDVNPYRWEANDGSLMEIGPDGQPRQVYKDPTPKVTYMNVDNADGTKTVYPVVNGQIVTGGGQRPQVGAIIPDPRKQGGQSGAPTGGFRGGI